MRRTGLVALAGALVLATSAPAAAAPPADHVHTDLVGGDIASYVGEAVGSNISADGRFVAYVVETPDEAHIVVEDRFTGTVAQIPSPPRVFDPVMTPDGRFLAFSAGPIESPSSVHVHDRRTGVTEVVSLDRAGGTVHAGDPSISDDGRFVTFSTEASIDPADGNARDADGGAFATDVYLRDRQAGTTTLASAATTGAAGEHGSFAGRLSGDGRFVVFASRSRDIVPADGNGEAVDTFRWSVERRTTERIGLTASGHQPPNDVLPGGVSRDGRMVALMTESALVAHDRDGRTDGYVRDVDHGTVTLVETTELSYAVVLSADGRVAAFLESDSAGSSNVVVQDLATGRREQVDIGPRGSDLLEGSRPRLSADGRHVALTYLATVTPESRWDQGLRTRMAVRERYGSLHVGLAVDADGGYRPVTESGDVFALGGASWHGSTSGLRLRAPVVGAAPTPSGDGYWLAAADGGVFSFGDAPFRGSAGSLPLRAPVVGMAPTPSGDGYWLVAADGGVFSFGDARFHGSAAALPLKAPVVGMAATPSGAGYWLVAADGGVFSFGDARFHGSTGALRLAAPVVGMAPTPSGGGYWLAAADGGVFTFGDAPFRGSAAPAPVAVTSIVSPAADGYWLIDADGTVRSFGSAPDHGSR